MDQKRFEQLSQCLDGVEGSKKEIMISLLKDFVVLEERIEKLRPFPCYKIDPRNPERQIKLPVHDMLKDLQAQKNDIAVKILRTLDGGDEGESPLAKALKEFR